MKFGLRRPQRRPLPIPLAAPAAREPRRGGRGRRCGARLGAALRSGAAAMGASAAAAERRRRRRRGELLRGQLGALAALALLLAGRGGECAAGPGAGAGAGGRRPGRGGAGPGAGAVRCVRPEGQRGGGWRPVKLAGLGGLRRGRGSAPRLPRPGELPTCRRELPAERRGRAPISCLSLRPAEKGGQERAVGILHCKSASASAIRARLVFVSVKGSVPLRGSGLLSEQTAAAEGFRGVQHGARNALMFRKERKHELGLGHLVLRSVARFGWVLSLWAVMPLH